MRTFRFITTESSATEGQEQTISCNLHLEPVNDVISTQPENCSCHTEADCLNQGIVVNNRHNNHENFRNISDTVSVVFSRSDGNFLFKFRWPGHI